MIILISQVIWSFKMKNGINMETYTSKLIDDLLDSINPIDQEKVDAKMLLAAKIADAMKAKKWKNKDLLKAVGKDNPSIITKWLSGTHNFTMDTLIELEHALEIKLLALVEQEEEVIVNYHKTVSQKVQSSPIMDWVNEILGKEPQSIPTFSSNFSFTANNSQHSLARA